MVTGIMKISGFLIFITSLLYAGCVDAILCYTCKGFSNVNCTRSNVPTTRVMNCSTSCYAISSYSKVRYNMRGCSKEYKPNGCQTELGYIHCVCSTDLCNRADVLHTRVSIVIAGLLLSVLCRC